MSHHHLSLFTAAYSCLGYAFAVIRATTTYLQTLCPKWCYLILVLKWDYICLDSKALAPRQRSMILVQKMSVWKRWEIPNNRITTCRVRTTFRLKKDVHSIFIQQFPPQFQVLFAILLYWPVVSTYTVWLLLSTVLKTFLLMIVCKLIKNTVYWYNNTCQ